jgi:tetratricopeptide (TPR) repeat protein
VKLLSARKGGEGTYTDTAWKLTGRKWAASYLSGAMAEPVSLGGALTLGVVGHFVTDQFRDAGVNLAKGKSRKWLSGLLASPYQALPQSPDLNEALRRALAKATGCLAWQLYDPARRPALDLLENVSDWPKLFDRALEHLNRNIVAGTPAEAWLADLARSSKSPRSFADFPLKVLITDDRLTNLLEPETDAAFRDHIHTHFLVWVKKHVPDNGHRPAEFADRVRDGWQPAGPKGATLTFYDVFCLFFREELKNETEIFRAFTANVLTGLKQDITKIKATLPDATTLQRFTETLSTLEEKEFDANYARFKQWTLRQNEKLCSLLRDEFSGIHKHLDRQDKKLAGIGKATADTQKSVDGIRRWLPLLGIGSVVVILILIVLGWQSRALPGQVAAALLQALSAQAKASVPSQERSPALDFPTAFRSVAEQFRITPAEARRVVEQWIAENRNNPDLSERAKAEFLARRFAEAARLSDAAAAEKLSRSGDLRAESARLISGAVQDLIRSGESFRAEGDHAQALDRFQMALTHCSRSQDAQVWASLQGWLGLCHLELGVRVEGAPAKIHLADSVAAFRLALQVQAREKLPQDWAMTQNNLGIALYTQAVRSAGPEAVRLLSEAVTAFRLALQVRTREDFRQDWAITQNNLGNALMAQADRSAGSEAARLLTEAVAAYRLALQVRTREQFPRDWAMTQNNLGNGLRTQAARSAGPETARLLAEAVAAYRLALRVRTRERLPQDWAETQNNLGNALYDQAGQSAGPEAARLLVEAVAAIRLALQVYTLEESPQDWAMAQNSLGAALHAQAGQSAGPEAARLLTEAVVAVRLALQVYTREEFPQDWAMSQNNLGAALHAQADRSVGPEAARLLAEAVVAVRLALQVYTLEEFPQDWAMSQNNLGNALYAQAARSADLEASQLLAEAVAAYRLALRVRTREQFPQYWAMTQNNLGTALGAHAARSVGPEAARLLTEAVQSWRNALEVWTPSEFPNLHKVVQRNLALAEENLKQPR